MIGWSPQRGGPRAWGREKAVAPLPVTKPAVSSAGKGMGERVNGRALAGVMTQVEVGVSAQSIYQRLDRAKQHH
jgi:hypothetical protein